MKNLELVKVTSVDCEYINKLRLKLVKLEYKKACIEIPENLANSQNISKASFEREKEGFRIVRLEGKNIGYVKFVQGDLCELYISPKSRNNGIGSAVLSILEKECKKLCVVVRKSNHDAIRFYENNGFEYLEDWGSVLYLEKHCGLTKVTFASGKEGIMPIASANNFKSSMLDRVVSCDSVDTYAICTVYYDDLLVSEFICNKTSSIKEIATKFATKIGYSGKIGVSEKHGLIEIGDKRLNVIKEMPTRIAIEGYNDVLIKDICPKKLKKYKSTDGNIVTEEHLDILSTDKTIKLEKDKNGNIIVIKDGVFVDILREVK